MITTDPMERIAAVLEARLAMDLADLGVVHFRRNVENKTCINTGIRPSDGSKSASWATSLGEFKVTVEWLEDGAWQNREMTVKVTYPDSSGLTLVGTHCNPPIEIARAKSSPTLAAAYEVVYQMTADLERLISAEVIKIAQERR